MEADATNTNARGYAGRCPACGSSKLRSYSVIHETTDIESYNLSGEPLWVEESNELDYDSQSDGTHAYLCGNCGHPFDQPILPWKRYNGTVPLLTAHVPESNTLRLATDSLLTLLHTHHLENDIRSQVKKCRAISDAFDRLRRFYLHNYPAEWAELDNKEGFKEYTQEQDLPDKPT